jgi:hypothetical protein
LDSVLADSHSSGGKVTVSKATGKQCDVCRGPIRSSKVMVPVGGWGRATVRFLQSHGGQTQECGLSTRGGHPIPIEKAAAE